MMYAAVGAAVLAVAAAAGGYALGHRHGVESQADEIRGWIEQAADLDTRLAAQNAAVAELQAKAAKRTAEAARARQRADELARDLAAREQQLLAARRLDQEDPCAAACRLLSQPL